MCWNAEVSLNTFIFALVSFFIVIGLNKIPLISSLIVLSVSLIQLYEYFAWKNIHNKKIIYYLSIFGSFIILLQLLLINYSNLKGTERIISISLIIIIGIIWMIYNYYNNKFDIKVGENGHLIWYWVDVLPILLILIFILYLYPMIKNNNILTFLFTSLALLISLYYYYKYKTWGTLWCYFSNIIWIYFILKSIYLYINI
jgi:hypothetical protein